MSVDFKKWLKCAIILLGGKEDLLTIIDNSEKDNSSFELRKWNAKQMDNVKHQIEELTDRCTNH